MGWSAPRVGRADNRAKHAARRDKCSVGGRLVLHVTKRARAARHGTRKRRLRQFEAAAADVARCRWRIASANMCLPPGQWIGVSWWFGQLIVSYAQFVRTDPRIDVNGLTAVKWALVWRCNCWTIVSQPRAKLREEQITCSSCAIRTNHGTRQRVWSVCLRFIAAQGDPIAAAAPRLANKSNATFQWPCHRVIAWCVPRSAGDPRGRPFAVS